jgi:hypothetical protein
MQGYRRIAAALALCALSWPAGPLAQAPAPAPAKARAGAEPRAIAPRGPLAEDEQRNMAVFRAAFASTVHITTVE